MNPAWSWSQKYPGDEYIDCRHYGRAGNEMKQSSKAIVVEEKAISFKFRADREESLASGAGGVWSTIG